MDTSGRDTISQCFQQTWRTPAMKHELCLWKSCRNARPGNHQWLKISIGAYTAGPTDADGRHTALGTPEALFEPIEVNRIGQHVDRCVGVTPDHLSQRF